MANLGEITEVINNASKLVLQVGADTYIMLQELEFLNNQSVSRRPTTDGKARYFYGVNDISFDATLVATTPEITDFDTKTLKTATGGLTSTSYKILATNKAGGTKTITASATLPLFKLLKALRGGVKFRMRFQITTETVAIT